MKLFDEHSLCVYTTVTENGEVTYWIDAYEKVDGKLTTRPIKISINDAAMMVQMERNTLLHDLIELVSPIKTDIERIADTIQNEDED